MFARNKEEEKKKKIMNLLLFKYMIDYIGDNLFSFSEYIDSKDDNSIVGTYDLIQEFEKLRLSIQGDII